MKSPTAKAEGVFPVGGVAAVVNVPSPLPSRMVTVLSPLLDTARSGMPSPLKSPTTIPDGVSPVAGIAPLKNPPFPAPRRIVTVLSPLFAMARSDLPSPLKSAATIDTGLRPASAIDTPTVKFPWPSFSYVVTTCWSDVPASAASTAISALPFPKKFPTPMASIVLSPGMIVGA